MMYDHVHVWWMILFIVGSYRMLNCQGGETNLTTSFEEDRTKEFIKVGVDAEDLKIGQEFQSVVGPLCMEAGTLGETFVRFEDECEGSLRNMNFHFEIKSGHFRKAHIAQVISRNLLVNAVAKRSKEVEYVSQLNGFTTDMVRYQKMDLNLKLAKARLVNARDKCVELMKSREFSNETLSQSAAFSRYCAQACDETIEHAKNILKAIGSARSSLDDTYDADETAAIAGPVDMTCSGQTKPLKDVLATLIQQSKHSRQVWTEPLRAVSNLWSRSNQVYDRDRKVNAAMFKWTEHAPSVKPMSAITADDWESEKKRVIRVKDAVTEVVELDQKRVRLPLGNDGNSSGSLNDVIADVSRRNVLHATLNVSMSTIDILNAYYEYAAASSVLYASVDDGNLAKEASKARDDARMALHDTMQKNGDILEKASAVIGRWHPPAHSEHRAQTKGLHSEPSSLQATEKTDRL